jgi:hypothetical protein
VTNGTEGKSNVGYTTALLTIDNDRREKGRGREERGERERERKESRKRWDEMEKSHAKLTQS